MRAGREAVGNQHRGNGVHAGSNLRIGALRITLDHAGSIMRDARAAIEIVDHPHCRHSLVPDWPSSGSSRSDNPHSCSTAAS